MFFNFIIFKFNPYRSRGLSRTSHHQSRWVKYPSSNSFWTCFFEKHWLSNYFSLVACLLWRQRKSLLILVGIQKLALGRHMELHCSLCFFLYLYLTMDVTISIPNNFAFILYFLFKRCITSHCEGQAVRWKGKIRRI